MRKTLISIFLLLLSTMTLAATTKPEPCMKWSSWLKPICTRMHQLWYEGHHDLYLTGYAWHNRFAYEKYKIDGYNELAWGGGLGKGFYDEDGDLHGIYAFAFLDSHKNIEPAVGYSFLKMAHLDTHTAAGIGFSVLVTQRKDLFNGIPFPGALPFITLSHRRVSLLATYIPGSPGSSSHQTGNVLFVLLKWTLDTM